MPPFNNFTTKAKEVIRKAHELAIERGQNHVNSLHLLTALLIQEDSMVVSILDKMEIEGSTHRVAVPACIGCALKENFRKDKFFYSNKFIIR